MTDYIVGSRKPKPGDKVYIIQRANYGTEDYDLGVVKDVLTSRAEHPRGHKVRLTNGTIGRVQKFADQGNVTPRQPRYEQNQSSFQEPQGEQAKYYLDPDDLV